MVGGVEGIPAELEGLSLRQSPVLHDRCNRCQRRPVPSRRSCPCRRNRTIPAFGRYRRRKGEGCWVEVAFARISPIPVAALAHVVGHAEAKSARLFHMPTPGSVPTGQSRTGCLLPGDDAAQLPSADRLFHQLAFSLSEGAW